MSSLRCLLLMFGWGTLHFVLNAPVLVQVLLVFTIVAVLYVVFSSKDNTLSGQ